MKTYLSFLTLLLCSINLVLAQDLPTIIPPSPNAASLGAYGQVPVGLFTGTPNANIPLYTVTGRGLSVPISLNYSSNGIRVDEVASNVGLGWAINAGGAISRTIMDDPDESQTLAPPVNFPDLTQQTLDYLQNSTNSADGYDTLADMYSFNFNGFSGKFYLDENKNPVLINPSPVKIERAPDATYAFKIIGPSGVIYWFGDSTSTEKILHRSKGAGHDTWTGENPTSWYLRKIEHPLGDEITFNYTASNYKYNAGLSQQITRDPVGNEKNKNQYIDTQFYNGTA